MFVTISGLRQGIEIDRDRLKECLTRYNCILSNASMQLYNEAYLSTPEFDEKEVKLAITQEFPEFCKYLMDVSTGEYPWSRDMLTYAKLKTRSMEGGAEFGRILSIFSEALLAKENVGILTNIVKRIAMHSSRPQIIKPRFSTSCWLTDLSVYGCNSDIFIDILKRNQNTEIQCIDTRIYMRDYIITKYMGISQEKLDASTGSSGFFIKGISRDEELSLIHLIATNSVECDTKFGQRYTKKRNAEYKEDFESMHVQTRPAFDTQVFVDTLDIRNEAISKERDKLKAQGLSYKSFFITPYAVYLEVSNPTAKGDTRQALTGSGQYIIDACGEVDLQLHNLISGISGEFISKKQVEKKGYHPIASPVQIKHLTYKADGSVNITQIPYYRLSDVLYNDAKNADGEYISKQIDSSIKTGTLKYVSEEDILKHFNAKDRLDLFDVIRGKVRLHSPECFKTYYRDFVADLVCAYLYLNLANTEYVFRNSFYEYLPESARNKAFLEAERIYQTHKNSIS